jgi:hypothetical protein
MSLEFYAENSFYLDKTIAKPEKIENFPFQVKSSEIWDTSAELGKTFELPCIQVDNLVKTNNKELKWNRTIDVEPLCKQFHQKCFQLKKALTLFQIQHILYPTFLIYSHQNFEFLEANFSDY